MGMFGFSPMMWSRRGNGLLNDLIFCLECEETSGTRFDAHTNSLDFADNNTVGNTTGKVGDKAALFVSSNTEYLSRDSESLLQTGDIDFTIGGWIWHNSWVNDAFRGLPNKWTNPEDEYIFASNTTNQTIRWLLSSDGNTTDSDLWGFI